MLTFPYIVIANDDYLFKTCFKILDPKESIEKPFFPPEILV